ncbi:unnamed protein product [Medioppia subpectinata]|uniref:CAAX prenyl protease n=1 Tax=Medioppia subpectinata TaxID=1979941 RepID=A0A7R9L3J5_9ACAR|nr:unnamed protein product [Medioppia subpectinata]CAG2114636.1 unnamed protein product [Medioppia subpectinata]
MHCLFIEYIGQQLTTYCTENNVFVAVFAYLWLSLSREIYLTTRQLNVYRSAKLVPKELRPDFDLKTFNKCIQYNSLRLRVWIVADVYHHLLTAFVLWFQVIPLLWRISDQLLPPLGFAANNELIQTLVFVTIGSLLSTIADLPISLYRTFVVEQKYGFNKQTIGFYAKDRLMKFVVMQTIVGAVIGAAVYIIQNGGQYFGVYLWLYSFAVTLFLMTIYPDLIAPLFDSFTPLPDGQLKTSIERLAESIDFPLKKIYVIKGSKRSAHSNAYFFGIYKNKQIVLYDTLFRDFHTNKRQKGTKSADTSESSSHQKMGCTDEEIVSIMAHELGHWYLSHALKYLAVAETVLLVYITLYSMLYQNEVLFSAFGFEDKRPVFVGLYLMFRFVFWPLNDLLWFAFMCLSRRFESGADAFEKSMKKGPHMRSSLIRLFMDNLGSPVNDNLYSAWNHSHPTLLQRLKAFKTD